MVFELRLFSPSFQLSEAESLPQAAAAKKTGPFSLQAIAEGLSVPEITKMWYQIIRDNRLVFVMNMDKKNPP